MRTAEAANRLVEVGKDFYRRGWALGTSGNFSIVLERDPLKLAITASSLDKGRLMANQIVCVGDDGRPDEPGGRRPSAETLLHIAIAQTTGAGAVLHTHSVWSTVLSDYHAGQAGFFIAGYEMLKGLSGVTSHEHSEWFPILLNSQDLASLSAEAAKLLREQSGLHAFLIQRHGLYCWGRDLDETIRHVEIVEFLLESVARRRMMGPA